MAARSAAIERAVRSRAEVRRVLRAKRQQIKQNTKRGDELRDERATLIRQANAVLTLHEIATELDLSYEHVRRTIREENGR